MTVSDKILQTRDTPLILTDTNIQHWLKGTDDSRYGLIKRALARKDLIQIRRGLYVLGEPYRKRIFHPFELGQAIYGPSFISFESALSFWGLIPEAVYTITSACSKRSKNFDTPFGRFSYSRIPFHPLLTQVKRIVDGQQIYFIAKPLRALSDYVYASGESWDFHSLLDSLRIDEMPALETQEINELKQFYHHSRVQHFLKSIERD